MTTLLVDIGNTRIKWARYATGTLARRSAAAHAGWHAADYQRRLFRARSVPAETLVASVAGAGVKRALAVAARRAGSRVRFITVAARAGGITVGYTEPWRLGVDRFVAAVGAHRLLPATALCIVAVGTALTIDILDPRGRHHGGVIIPAPDLMIATLLDHTDGIRRRTRGGSAPAAGLFGRSTRSGVVGGARYAAAALIDRAVAEARPIVGRTPLVVLTGGAASAVRPLVTSRCVSVPDLVLRGLAAFVDERTASRR